FLLGIELFQLFAPLVLTMFLSRFVIQDESFIREAVGPITDFDILSHGPRLIGQLAIAFFTPYQLWVVQPRGNFCLTAVDEQKLADLGLPARKDHRHLGMPLFQHAGHGWIPSRS